MKIKVDNQNNKVLIEDVTFSLRKEFVKELEFPEVINATIILESSEYLKLQQLFLDQWYN